MKTIEKLGDKMSLNIHTVDRQYSMGIPWYKKQQLLVFASFARQYFTFLHDAGNKCSKFKTD